MISIITYNIKIMTCVHLINYFYIIITCLKYVYYIILNGRWRRVLKFFIGDEYTYANRDYKWIPLSVRIFQWHSNNEGDSTIEKCSRYIYIYICWNLMFHSFIWNVTFTCWVIIICFYVSPSYIYIYIYTRKYIIVIIIISLKTLNESFDSPSCLALN